MRHLYLPQGGSWFAGARLRTTLTLLAIFAISAFKAQTPDLVIECPEDGTYECGVDEIPAPVANASDFTSEVFFDYSEVVLNDDPCETVVSRTWTVSVDEQVEMCTHIYTLVDNTAPYFLDVPVDLSLQCIEEVEDPAECLAEDNCDDDVFTEIFTIETGAKVDSCVLTTATGLGDDWSVWLPGLEDLDGIPTDDWHFQDGAYFISYEDNSAEIFGVVENSEDPSLQFEVQMFFQNGADWTTWSGMGRSYKDDAGFASADMLYEDWTYYEMVANFSRLTGLGALAGSELYLSHAPSSYYFGFQCGEAANNKNENFGLSGWFSYEGSVNGTDISGSGDINVDKECFTIGEDDCINNTEFTYMWRAEDNCGNQSFSDQIITVFDDTPPVFTNTPDDLVLECEEWPVPVFDEIEATDNCDTGILELNYEGEFIEEESECYSVYLRIWRAIDYCLNETEYVQTIIVQDTTSPEFDFVPEDITVECDEEVPMVMATATDNCNEVEVTYEDVEEGDSCYMTITRTFTATDLCENTSTAVQIITVVDTTSPVFDPYEVEVFVNCEDLEDVEPLTATDNCNEFEITVEEMEMSGGCMGSVHRIYTAEDICGNSTTVEQFIVLVDNTPPVIDNPENETVECDNVPETPGADGIDIYDNCGLDVEVEFTEEVIDGVCENSYTIVWTWTATDYCENTSTATTTITVVDSTDPYWIEETLPSDLALDCTEDLPPVVLPEAEDNCDDDVTVEMTSETIEEGDCPQNYTVQRIFRGTDNCGNEVLYAQLITFSDTTPPVILIDDSVTIECTDPVPADNCSATDDCGEVTLEVEETEVGDSCETIITRTCTATDECGNSATAVQVITILDTTPPTVSVPEDSTIECDEDLPEPVYTTEDNCNDVTVEIIEDWDDEDWCEVILTRTYIPTDACGNVGEAQTEVITIVDTTAPVVDPYEVFIEVNCEDVAEGIFITASDNCHEIEITYSDLEVSGACPYEIIRDYVITDMCGNTSTAQQIIHRIDEIGPEFVSFPDDITIECDEEVPSADYGESMIEIIDNCTEPTLEYSGSEIIDGDCPQEYMIVHTWTAIDECLNETVMSWTINVVDTTAPELEVGADQTIECTEDVPVATYGVSDNCDEDVEVVINETEEGDSCLTTITRTYTATDDCGNQTTMIQVITVVDTTAPSVNPANDVTIECTDPVPPADYTVEDNCNDVTVDIEETTEGDACETIITRYYTPTDACGNIGQTEIQVITIVDTTAPTVDPADDITIECTDPIPSPDYTTDDNCNDVTVEISEEEGGDSCLGTITRYYTPTDACGNVGETMTQVITIVDTTPPVINAAADITVECDEDLPQPDWTASDACNEYEVEVTSEVEEGDCPQEYVMTRTYTATDICGNTSTDTQVITVVDTTAPVIEAADDVTIECTEEVPMAEYEATDNCSFVSVEVTEVESGDSCETIITRTYIATDNCGNSSSDTQIITIVDTTNPFFTSIPEGGSFECDEGLPEVEATADDACSGVTVTSMEEVIPTECDEEYTVVITWTATDDCGNSVQATTTYEVYDATAPILEELDDLVIDCDDDVPAALDLEATDNCDDNVIVTSSDEIIGELPDPDAELDCNTLNPVALADFYEYDWGMLLYTPEGWDYYQLLEGEFLQYEDGTAHFTATFESYSDPGAGFYADVYFENGLGWTEWSTQEFPTSYKDDLGLAGDNYLDWTYYLMNSDMAQLTGWGLYEGSSLNLAHAPANFYYGFQVGVAANNVNENYGAGGWFTYEGIWINSETGAEENVEGAGDFAWDSDCCPEYYVERTYCAVDCAGNSTCFTQTITFEDLDGEVGGEAMNDTHVAHVKGDFDFARLAPNPAFYRTFVDFRSNIDTRLIMDIYDAQGHLVKQVFNQNVSENTAYRLSIETGDMESGVYTLRLSSMNDSKTTRLVVVK